MAYSPGTRVKVLSQSKYPNEELTGLVGTVKIEYSASVAVQLETAKNSRSAYGYFYFKPSELLVLDEFVDEIMEEKNMNAITNYLNVARVKFINDRKDGVYTYANFDPDLRAGDTCVVRNEDDRFVVAVVVEITPENNYEAYREVVAKVDIEKYHRRIEVRAKAAELKAKMENRAKQLQDIALYQMLAKDDPEMASILQEYQCLSKV